MHAQEANVTCPGCGIEFPLTEAVSRRIREELAQDFEQKRCEYERSMAEREKRVREALSEIEARRKGLEAELESRLEEQRKTLMEQAARRARENAALEIRDLEAQVQEQRAKIESARAAELEWRKEKRRLEERQQSMEVELARKLDEEREAIVEQARRQALEEQQLRLAEKEKLIGDLQKQIETLKQKAEQGSVQLQGEVMELELEELLREQFRTDLIEPVAKGQRGADILQRVQTNSGLACGSILWEVKRTKQWGRDWAGKLKEDQRACGAELAVLVSRTMPPDCRNFGQVDGIWVCDFACALPLAAALRQGLVAAAAARQSETGKQTKMEQLYSYLAGTEFRHRVEALVEAFLGMRKELDEEQRVFAKRWAARGKLIEQLIQHTAMLYGGIQGIVGQSTLPEIASLQLSEGNADMREG